HAPLEVAAVPRPAVDTDFVVPPLAVVATSEDGSGPRSSTPKLAQISEKSRRRFEALRGFVEWAGRSSGQAALSYVASRQPAAGKRDPRTAPIGLPTDPLAGTTTRPVSPVEPLPTNTSGDPTTTTTSGEGLAAATDVDVPTEVATKLASSTGAARKNPPSISGGPHGWGAGILRGAQAFAQLENGHFFVGRVQKVEEEELVMTWGQAEISFLPGDLQKLLPLATQEVDILRGGPEGYVKLKNQNKIWGQILEDLPDVVTIQKGEHRIVIPKVAVAQVTKQKEAQVRLGRNDQDWSEDSLPQAEPDLPNVQVEPELQSGAIRVQLDSDTQKSRSDELRARIRKAVPVGPMR
nr:hypothetical protein [Planctomycetota bacterium]